MSEVAALEDRDVLTHTFIVSAYSLDGVIREITRHAIGLTQAMAEQIEYYGVSGIPEEDRPLPPFSKYVSFTASKEVNELMPWAASREWIYALSQEITRMVSDGSLKLTYREYLDSFTD
jgi:hypothetical protein